MFCWYLYKHAYINLYIYIYIYAYIHIFIYIYIVLCLSHCLSHSLHLSVSFSPCIPSFSFLFCSPSLSLPVSLSPSITFCLSFLSHYFFRKQKQKCLYLNMYICIYRTSLFVHYCFLSNVMLARMSALSNTKCCKVSSNLCLCACTK